MVKVEAILVEPVLGRGTVAAGKEVLEDENVGRVEAAAVANAVVLVELELVLHLLDGLVLGGRHRLGRLSPISEMEECSKFKLDYEVRTYF